VKHVPNLFVYQLEVNGFPIAIADDEVGAVTLVVDADVLAEVLQQLFVCNRSWVLGIQMLHCQLRQVSESVHGVSLFDSFPENVVFEVFEPFFLNNVFGCIPLRVGFASAVKQPEFLSKLVYALFPLENLPCLFFAVVCFNVA